MAVFLAIVQSALHGAVVRGQGASPPIPSLRLTLPQRSYAVSGRAFRIYYENLILSESPEKFRFKFTLERDGKQVSLGQNEPRRWSLQPEVSHAGWYDLRVAVSDGSNKVLATGRTTLVITPADAGAGRSLSLLIVGDSLTHASVYPNELAKLLSSDGNPKWSMFGTHRPASVKEGVAHEGYGGWTWDAFADRYSEKSFDENGRRSGSPFVFADAQGKPQLDPARYFEMHCGGKRPDVITFLLGINDCFSAPPDDPKKLDERIDSVFVHAEKLLAAMRKAAPQTMLAICITPPPNVREEAFEANYKGRYPRWGWRKIQHRLVERQIKQFGDREQERVSLVPTELSVDPVEGYPPDNGVHPNEQGYRQIAESIYAWLKWRQSLPE